MAADERARSRSEALGRAGGAAESPPASRTSRGRRVSADRGLSRRDFIAAGTSAALGLGLAGCATGRSAVGELEALLVDAPRDDLPEQLARRVAMPDDLDALAAALMSAALRHVVPRARFGPHQHALLVVYGAHRSARGLDGVERALPLLWAADFFRHALAGAAEYEPEPLVRVDDERLPDPGVARRELLAAIEAGVPERASASAVALWRSGRQRELAECLCLFGARDFRHIGHKTIFVANGLRLSERVRLPRREALAQSIGLALALRYRDPGGRDFDGSWVANRERAARLDSTILAVGRGDDGATRELLAVMRSGDQDQAGAACAAVLRAGVGAQAVHDAVLCHAAELYLNRPANVIALHAVTTADAMLASCARIGDEASRRLVLLQAASRAAFFQEYATANAAMRREPMTEERIDALDADGGRPSLAAVLAAPRDDPPATARRALAWMREPADLARFAFAVRRSTAWRAVDNHDFKWTEAFLESAALVSAPWRRRFLACSCGGLRGWDDPEPPLQARVRELWARAHGAAAVPAAAVVESSGE